jgi:hypothetical protein
LGKAQRIKGSRGELEAAKLLQRYGFDGKRHGRHFHGLGGHLHEDVTHSIPNRHIEVKRCERVDVWSWEDQAKAGANGKLWAVLFRKNRRKWKILVDAEDWLAQQREIEDLKEALRNGESVVS